MLYYTAKDLKEHKQLLAEAAQGKKIDWSKMSHLEFLLTKQALETILQPKEKEDVLRALCSLGETMKTIALTKDLPPAHPYLHVSCAVIATLELLSKLDPLQSVPWKTRIFVDDCLNVAALRVLVKEPTTYISLAEEQLLISTNGDYVSYSTTKTILKKMANHKLAQRTVHGRFSVYHITDFGKKVLQLVDDGRL